MKEDAMKDIGQRLIALAVSLTQVKDQKEILELFVASINSEIRGYDFIWISDDNKSHESVLPISTSTNTYGYIQFKEELLVNNEHYSIIQNLCKIVAFILEKNEHEDLLSLNEKRHQNVLEEKKVHHEKTVAQSETETIFHYLLLNSPVYVFFKDSEMRSLRLSKNYEELLGRPMDDLLGKSMDDLFPSDLAKSMIEDDKRILNYGQPEVINEELNDKSYTTYKFPIFIDGKPTYLAGYTIDVTDQESAIKRLVEIETLFKNMVDNSPMGMHFYELNSDGRLIFVGANPAADKLLNTNNSKFVGKTIQESFPELAQTEVPGRYIDAAEKGVIWSTDQIYYQDDVIYGAFEVKAFQTSPNKMVAVFSDVTEKMNREIELRKLSSAVEQSQASIVITDSFGNIEYVNSKLCEITGYSREELIGVNPRIMSSGETSQEEYKNLWSTIKSGYEWKGEFHNKKKNGELYWESASISPIKNEKGEIDHYLGIKEDISDKKAMEEAVVASEQRYRELFLNNPVPTYIFDEVSLEFVEVNDATVDKYGYSREEFATMTLKDIRPDEDINDLLESVKTLNKLVFQSDKMRHKSRDGVIFPVELTSHSLPEKNGRKTRLVSATDITERVNAADQMKLAIEQAEASDRLKTTFLNNISHEVRTPLNGILGFAEIITQTGLNEEDKMTSLKMLSESSERLLNTITNYMDISLITSGSMSVRLKYFNPEEVFRSINLKLHPSFSEKNLNLVLEIPENNEKLKIFSDPDILQKIIYHLLNNAIKFTEKGFVSFGYKIYENDLEIYVKDTGIGIGEESRNEIFNRFVKEDRGPSRLSEGSGLGLSIVKGMSVLLGGRISIESELEVGSRFSILFPLNEYHDIQEAEIPEKILRVNDNSKSILVAEDDDTNFLYLKTVLNRETNLKVIHAKDGNEAISLYKANKNIALILMDIKMPVIDGLEATRQIKLINSKVPVIAITAYAMLGDMTRIMDAGCDGYISKPITKSSLLKLISKYVKI